MRVFSLITVIILCALMGWLVYMHPTSMVADSAVATVPVFVHQVQHAS